MPGKKHREPFVPPIGPEQLRRATQTLQRYKAGKANLEKRIIENEQWYKLRHWDTLPTGERQVQPASAWLFNAIANKHADAMDNLPAPTVLPREASDRALAEMLTSILPVILEQNDFEKTYDEVWSYKLKTGTGVYGVFWDPTRLNGLGDIAIEKVDLLNLFWESGITDIQASRSLFHVALTDNDLLIASYPQLNGKLGHSTVDVAKYVYDDTVDTADKSVVVDWYYKKRDALGRTVLHYCKYVNDTVLFATENEPAYAARGFYDHGRYPFEFDPLFRVEGTPAGFGYLDVGKSAQEYIDRGNQAMLENMLANARPRHFIRRDGAVDEKEYADMNNDFIHVDGNLGQDSILPVQGKPLSGVYLTLINNKIDELKEVTGNRDVSSGGSSGGVTAASAIAAMQEAGSKLSRDANRQSYRVFRQICLTSIELIRQFYDLPRCFRILGPGGAQRYLAFSNAGLRPQSQGVEFGLDMGLRMPVFDIRVAAQKQSPYSQINRNELALQLYHAGFFKPELADQALACLDMMDFEGKELLTQRIRYHAGWGYAGQAVNSGQMPAPGQPITPNGVKPAGVTGAEPESMTAARRRVAESTRPR